MIDVNYEPDHYVQRYILDVLRKNQFARFRDLRPQGVDSNAFSYHLTRLVKQQFVEKSDQGYTLTIRGIMYIDRIATHTIRPRIQPKIMTMIALVKDDQVLVRRKTTQPMINQITLPAGMLHMEDKTIEEAARREVFEKFGIELKEAFHHAGDCYMAVQSDEITVLNALMHVFYVDAQEVTISTPNGFWIPMSNLSEAAPATRLVVDLLRSWSPGDPRFFREFREDIS